MAPVLYVSEPFTYPGGALAVDVLARVYYAGTRVLAPIYHNAAGVRAPNPARTDGSGILEFYVEPGDYDILINGTIWPIAVAGDGGPGSKAWVLWTFTAGAPGNPGVGKSMIYNDFGRELQIASVRLSADSVTGLPLIATVNNNGTSIFTAPEKRPQLPVSAVPGTVKVTDIDLPTMLDGDALTVDVVQGQFAFMVLQVYVR